MAPSTRSLATMLDAARRAVWVSRAATRARQAWLSTHDSDPMTGDELHASALVPNLALRAQIEDWCAEAEAEAEAARQQLAANPQQPQQAVAAAAAAAAVAAPARRSGAAAASSRSAEA